MNILLIGGAGYIGTPLTTYFNKKGYKVTIYDNLQYQQELILPNGVTIIKDDVDDIEKYKKYIDNSDVIFYMNSPRLLHLGQKEQITPQLHFLKKTLSLLDNQKFYFFSSCSVYGHSNKLLDEDSETKITSFYSELKIKSEEIVLKRKKNTKILRLSTLFGYSPVSRNDLLINNFIRDIDEYEYLEIYDGDSWRPNIFINDLVEVLDKIIKIDIPFRVINVGSNELNITKLQLVEILQKFYRNKIKIVKVDAEDSRNYRVDFTKLNSYIDHNYTSYESAIKQMIL